MHHLKARFNVALLEVDVGEEEKQEEGGEEEPALDDLWWQRDGDTNQRINKAPINCPRQESSRGLEVAPACR